ncbi:hypothetical protein OG792_25135 [Micromonospora sp. NBC_01699]|uniref:hypothetical protein n=1 Tax=Micromonospora sp. NBC_01699 TaxID=2975984 RepID=UPI002E29C13B|nr:hypothetical protein [Micromonospora sp. NBC_01699]
MSSPPPAIEEQIDTMIAALRRRAKRTYAVALALRTIIAACSFFAILPDSALFQIPNYAQAYGISTTVAGGIGAVAFILASSLRLVDTINSCNESIAYLQERSIYLLTCDGLSRQIAEKEIRREMVAREASLQKDVFAGLDRSLDR